MSPPIERGSPSAITAFLLVATLAYQTGWLTSCSRRARSSGRAATNVSLSSEWDVSAMALL
ncbi:hypothetical protein EFW17_03380 [Halostreptopolyspora alba]|uniref:Uncharacterized protein n=1 Tax=Halostreptopolyspora alba TaxID=2487137 RepID=A0A3N0EG97_9ACTN|nr:hypothetical protein EFW17_03380 [Nocardiopsaceae bacterium YIM 96095]